MSRGESHKHNQEQQLAWIKLSFWVSIKEIWNNIILNIIPHQPCCFHCSYNYKQSSSISLWHLIESRVVVVIFTMYQIWGNLFLRGNWIMSLMWEWDSHVQSNLISMICTTLCDLVWYSVHPKVTPPMTIYDIPNQINPALKWLAAISFLKHGNCTVMLHIIPLQSAASESNLEIFMYTDQLINTFYKQTKDL